MKTLEQVNKARDILCRRVLEPDIDKIQLSLLVGMLNALVWVADGPDCSTVERVLAGEYFARKPQSP